jgi:hypothetical protein
MIQLQTFAALQKITSAFLNAFQDAAAPVSSLNGYLRGGDIRVQGSGQVVAAPISALILGNTYADSNGSELTISPTGLTPSVWYYVYAHRTGAGSPNIGLEVSTTAPDLALVFKTGDVTRRYLGCFPTTSGGGTPYTLRACRGRYLYADMTEASLAALSSGAATTYASVDLSAWVPPHAVATILHAELHNDTAGAQFAQLRPDGSSVDEYTVNAPAGDYAYADLEIVSAWEGNTSSIEYQVSNAGADTPNLSLFVRGFTEPSNP